MATHITVMRWLIENKIGFSHVHINKCVKKSQSSGERQVNYVPECSILFIQGLIPINAEICITKMDLHIYGYQKSSNIYKAIDITAKLLKNNDAFFLENILSGRLTVFSCYDEFFLFIVLSEKKFVKAYHTKFFPCRVLRNQEVFLNEVLLHDKKSFVKINENPSHKLNIKIFSFRDIHYNWEDPLIENRNSSNGNFLFRFEGNLYFMETKRCFFCFRNFQTQEHLKHHINSTHVFYKATSGPIKNLLSESFIKKYQKKINRGSSDSFTEYLDKEILDVSSFVPVNVKNKACFYFCKKPRIGGSVEHNFPYKYFMPETLEDFGMKKSSFDWYSFLITKKFDEIIDLPKVQIEIIRDWTIFIKNKTKKPWRGNIFEYIKEFVSFRKPSFDLFVFITCFYNNAVLSLEEICNIVSERVI